MTEPRQLDEIANVDPTSETEVLSLINMIMPDSEIFSM